MSEDTGRAEGKPPHLDRLSVLWQRLNDHKIVQWSVAYVALAYAIQHAIILTGESFEWPNIVPRISMLLLALGLPLVVTFAWYHGAKASRNFSQAELSILAALLVMSSLLFYVFVRPSEEGAVRTGEQAGVAASPKGTISLAVLPFANLSADQNQKFFSDGMTEEISSALAKLQGLTVLARSSSFAPEIQTLTAREKSRALNARYLIEGSVRQAGNRVRISAQLVGGADEVQIWSENYDRELTDIFAIQEEIAQAIAASLRVPLGLRQGQNLVSNRNIDPDSYQQYLRAKALLLASSNRDAIALLEPVVARNPNYAPAWGQLALAYVLTPAAGSANLSDEEFHRVVDASLPKAEAAGLRAIQIDAGLVDGYIALGRVQAARGKWELAENTFTKALALDANNHAALSFFGNMLAAVGRPKDGLAMKQRALTLEPFIPIDKLNAAWFTWLSGQQDAAFAMLNAMPADSYRSYLLAVMNAAAGRYGQAADAILQTPPGTRPRETLEDAARLLRRAPSSATSPQDLPRLSGFEFVYLHVGAPERVLERDERDLEAGYLVLVNAAFYWHPSAAPVRKTERFKTFVRKAGFVDYWRAKGWPPQCHPTTGDDFACS